MDDFDNYLGNRKKIIVFCISIVGIILFVVLFILNSNGAFSSDDYLIVGEHLVFKKESNKWIQLEPDKTINGNFILIDGDKKIDVNRISYDDNYKFYKNNNLLDVSDFRLVYRKNLNIKLANYSIDHYDFSDEQFVLEIANTEDNSDYELFRNSLKKITFDFDGDDNLETIYVMSDFIFGNGYRTPYSYMFLVKDGVVVDSIFEIDCNFYNFVDVLDMNNDGLYEIIVSKGAAEEFFDSCYQIYNVKGKDIHLIQDCKND